MNSLELLTEAVTGDITVGFELECIVPQDKNDPSQNDRKCGHHVHKYGGRGQLMKLTIFKNHTNI